MPLPDSRTQIAALAPRVRDELGLTVQSAARLGGVTHKFTHRTLHTQVFGCEGVSGRLQRNGSAASRWLPLDKLGDLALATLDQRIIELVRNWVGKGEA